MAISIVDSAENSEIDGADVTVDLSGIGLAEGDVVVAAQNYPIQSDVTATLTEQSGTWTQVAALYSSDSNDTNLFVYIKVMGATPDSSVTFDGDGTSTVPNMAEVQAYRGVDTTTPQDAAATTATGGNSPHPDGPSITTVTDGALVLSIGSNSEPEVGDLTGPSGYSNVVQIAAVDTVGGFVGIASLSKATAGAEDPGAWSGSAGGGNDSWAAVTMALRPDAGGGGGGIPVPVALYHARHHNKAA